MVKITTTKKFLDGLKAGLTVTDSIEGSASSANFLNSRKGETFKDALGDQFVLVDVKIETLDEPDPLDDFNYVGSRFHY